MSQIVTATYENGVLKPAEPLALPANAKVLLTVELVIEEPKPTPAERLAAMEELWRTSSICSTEPYLTRDQLHERR